MVTLRQFSVQAYRHLSVTHDQHANPNLNTNCQCAHQQACKKQHFKGLILCKLSKA